MIGGLVQNPLALPTAIVLSSLLGGFLLALAALSRFNLAKLRQSVLFQRWRTWCVIAPVYSLAVVAGPLATLALVEFLVFQGLREYARLAQLPSANKRILLALGLAVPLGAAVSIEAFTVALLGSLMVATLQPVLLRGPSASIRHLAFTALGLLYLPGLLSHLLFIYRMEASGPALLLVVGLAVALSDVGAFVVGRLYGRHRLAPNISPAKTWEGAAGNFAGVYLGAAALGVALPMNVPFGVLAALPFVIALGAIWGDLFESAIKRDFAAKDAGGWLPGFGGLLDRIDSLIIVAPLAYYFVLFVSGI